MSTSFIVVIYWSKTSFMLNQYIFNYHYVYFDIFKSLSSNEAYYLEWSICKININETIKIKYDEYQFYFNDVFIKNNYQLNEKYFNYHSISRDSFKILQRIKLMTSDNRNSELK